MGRRKSKASRSRARWLYATHSSSAVQVIESEILIIISSLAENLKPPSPKKGGRLGGTSPLATTKRYLAVADIFIANEVVDENGNPWARGGRSGVGDVAPGCCWGSFLLGSV